MAPQRPGQIDEISQTLGELRASFSAVERYMHDREHGLDNLSQKFDGLGKQIAKDIAAVEGRIEGRIKVMDDRLLALETAKAQDAALKSVWKWIIATMIAFGTVVAGFWQHK